MAAILGMEWTFCPEVALESEDITIIAKSIPYMLSQGLPYIPRVQLSEGSLIRSALRWLCSEEPVIRRCFIPQFT